MKQPTTKKSTAMMEAVRKWLFSRLTQMKKDELLQLEEQDLTLSHESAQDTLTLNNHTATVERLEELLVELQTHRRRVLRLQLSKVLFNQAKAEAFARLMSDPSCTVKELVFDKCRAKSDKVSTILGALSQNNALENLSMSDMNIPRDSWPAIATMLGENHSLHILTFHNTGINDHLVPYLADGLKRNGKISYLDMRQNVFESTGLQALLSALTGMGSLRTLRLDSMLLDDDHFDQFTALFQHENCALSNLELSDVEMSDTSSRELLSAVGDCSTLHAFHFGCNQITESTANSLVQMSRKFTDLNILALNHCEIHDSIGNIIFGPSFYATKLQFLNISWNHFSSAVVPSLCRVIEANPLLQKLTMQHNELGDGTLYQFALTIGQHPSLTYLDISQNKINNENFTHLFKQAQTESCKLKVFHCRKNQVGGPEVTAVLNTQSKHLTVLDLSSNALTDENARALLSYARKNVFIETLRIPKNREVSAILANQISEECASNIYIKHNILGQLPLSRFTGFEHSLYGSSCLKDFDVSQLRIENKLLDKLDFIVKFLTLNANDLTTVVLVNNQTRQVETASEKFAQAFLDCTRVNLRLQVLHIESMDFTARSMRTIIKAVKQLKQLSELHLVDLACLQDIMEPLCNAVLRHKSLRVLDLRLDNRKVRCRDVSQLVPLLEQNQVLREIDISGGVISVQNMLHLWLALHVNVNVTSLKYNRSNFYALEEMVAIDTELKINTIISESIAPVHGGGRGKIETLSFQGIDVPQYQAVIKYITRQKAIKTLDLSASGLRRGHLMQFVFQLVKRSLKLTTLNLSSNDTVNDEICTYLKNLFAGNSTLEHLYLDSTKVTFKGLKKVLDAMTDNLKMRTVSIQNCGIDFTQPDTKQAIMTFLDSNISVVTFNLEGNIIDDDIEAHVAEQTEINQQIVDKIFPQLIQQELNARKMAKTAKQRRNSRSSRNKVLPMAKTRDDKEIGESLVQDQPKGLAKILKQGSLDEAQEDGRGSKLPTINVVPPAGGNLTSRKTGVGAAEEDKEDPAEVSDSGASEQDENEDGDPDNNDLDKIAGASSNFQLKLIDKGVTNIKYVTKFIKVFPKIKTIDFGEGQLQQDDMQKFGEALKVNKYIQDVKMNKKSQNTDIKKILSTELEKNRAILDIKDSIGTSTDERTVDLANQNLKDLRFLPKMIADFTNLEQLDLSNSDLRTTEACKQICEMIDKNDTIRKLALRDCQLNAKGLALIADALTKKNNENLCHLDIQNNPIDDPQLKILFGLLQNNESLDRVDYSLYDEANIKKLEDFKKFHEEGLDLNTISMRISKAHSHHHRTPLWQKIIFPIALVKHLIHAKHEAFRFKYDTHAISEIESKLMPSIKRQLYFWSVVYYVIVFALPFVFKQQACYKTFYPELFYIYIAYIVLCALWEIYTVLKIQKTVKNAKILKFNSWHFVELLMGIVARTDTFLDILFVLLIGFCPEDYLIWLCLTGFFAILNLLFPLYMLVRLLRNDLGNSLIQPQLESTCFASFIRENMLLATVLDSFCINNTFSFFGKQFVFGKLMGGLSFWTQDFPQFTIHVFFKLVILSDAQKKLKTQTLLKVGIAVSAFAIAISLFNLIMCDLNEFDPIVLETELVQRQLKKKRHAEEVRRKQLAERRMSSKFQIDIFKKEMQKGMLNIKSVSAAQKDDGGAKQRKSLFERMVKGDGKDKKTLKHSQMQAYLDKLREDDAITKKEQQRQQEQLEVGIPSERGTNLGMGTGTIQLESPKASHEKDNSMLVQEEGAAIDSARAQLVQQSHEQRKTNTILPQVGGDRASFAISEKSFNGIEEKAANGPLPRKITPLIPDADE